MKEVLAVFKALSDETRLRILKLLEGGELCVCDIVAALDTSQPRASFHLAALKEAGLICDRREGRWIHYNMDNSDIFRRFLLVSALERVSGKTVEVDRKRLENFLGSKGDKTGLLDGIDKACCGSTGAGYVASSRSVVEYSDRPVLLTKSKPCKRGN
jgi:ArsR family transcriptional regulator